MPGPAPPSASYLLKIVDSSEEEEEESEDEEMAPLMNLHDQPKLIEDDNDEMMLNSINGSLIVEESPTLAHPRSDSVASVTSSTTGPPKKKKKKKNRNKNKKKKKKQSAVAATNVVAERDEYESTTAAAAAAGASTKSVSFDAVSVQSFERCLGTDVVPYDGGWPLGLGPPLDSSDRVPLETYETNKQERLRIRAQEKGIDVPINSDTEGGFVPLETRQWDYKHRAKNPLFHLLQEDRRMELLLEDSTPPEEEEDTISNTTSNHHSPTKRNSCNSASGSPKRRDSKSKNNKSNSQTSKRRDSKGSHNNNNNNGTKRRDSKSKHNSIPGPASNTRSRSGSFSQQERYNETYTQVTVHHVRNELEELRFQRTGEGHTGCQCRKLDVYLLPPNAGKKAHHRRMKVLRVKEELRKRHLLPSETKTREELELLLHDAVEKEGCCSSQDCPCVRNGIGCQADVCSCWHDSHQTKEGGKNDGGTSHVSVEEIQARCGNTNGMYAVDLNKISAMRQQILNQLQMNGAACCPPVSPHTPALVPTPDNNDDDDGRGVVNMVMA